MKSFGRYVLSNCTAAALLAACGGSQPPIGAPGAIPQTPARPPLANSARYKVLYSFGSAPDGSGPVASLIDVRGTLYGTTIGGGAYGSGTVFSITASGTEKVLHVFAGNGTDGGNPEAGLIEVGSTLYGTTRSGGMYGCGVSSYYDFCGTVFSITLGGKEKVLHYFGSYYSGDGSGPTAPLIEVNGTLSGTASQGGRNDCPESGYRFHCGTVFTVTPAGIEKVLYDFRKRTDANSPRAGLIDAGGTLYGTTYFGGDSSGCFDGEGCGSVFSLTTAGREKTLHVFGSGSDGRLPSAGLIEVNGTFYGTTTEGGTYGDGTAFSLTPGGAEKVLHSFDNTDGSTPEASLIDVKGTLYGTTSGGGTYEDGTVFSISTTGHENVLHSFSGGSDGSGPKASLTDVKGTLYGTTSGGGAYGNGTVFALTP